MIRHDDYYKHYEERTLEERNRLNYDHPNAFDTELLIRHLMELKQGRPVECPVYDYAVYNRSGRTRTIQPRQVVIVEGILIFENRSLCDLMDIRVFVDTDADIRIIRRIQRDVVERGRSLESVIGQYIHTVKPRQEQCVEPSKGHASIIGPEGGFSDGEVEAARNAGARTVTLGKRILRTETAGLFVLSAVGLLLED